MTLELVKLFKFSRIKACFSFILFKFMVFLKLIYHFFINKSQVHVF